MGRITKNGKGFVSEVICLLLGVVLPVSVFAATLGVPIVSQAPYVTTGCWAASGASVCQYYGAACTMGDFADACGATPNYTMPMSVIKYGLSQYGVSSVHYAESSNFSQYCNVTTLKAQIDANHPVVMNLSAHATVLNGYSGSYFSIMDPMSSTYVSVLASNLAMGDSATGYRLLECLFTS